MLRRRPCENQVIGFLGGPYVLPDKSPLFSSSCFAVYFDVTIITHLYGSFLSGDSRGASRVMCGGQSQQPGDCGCLNALNDAPDEQWGIGNHCISLLQHMLFSPLLPEPDYPDLSRLPQKHDKCHLSGTAELSALNVQLLFGEHGDSETAAKKLRTTTDAVPLCSICWCASVTCPFLQQHAPACVFKMQQKCNLYPFHVKTFH